MGDRITRRSFLKSSVIALGTDHGLNGCRQEHFVFICILPDQFSVEAGNCAKPPLAS